MQRLGSIGTRAAARFDKLRWRSLTRQAALKPVWKCKFVNTADSKHDLTVTASMLNRLGLL